MPDPSDPRARQVAEAALKSAQARDGLHRTADAAARMHGEVWARLSADPARSRGEFEAMQRTLGAEIADDVLRRTPQAFGLLTADAARAQANGRGDPLPREVLRTGQAWAAAEAQRPREPAAQVAGELQRAQFGMEPFRAFDHAQELKAIAERERQRELKRSLGLDRDRGRGR